MKPYFDFDPKKVAELRMAWYKSHHLKEYGGRLDELLALEIQELHGLEYNVAKKVTVSLVKAIKEHDLAEKKGISEEESQQHWDNALGFMTEHTEMLKEACKIKALSEAE